MPGYGGFASSIESLGIDQPTYDTGAADTVGVDQQAGTGRVDPNAQDTGQAAMDLKTIQRDRMGTETRGPEAKAWGIEDKLNKKRKAMDDWFKGQNNPGAAGDLLGPKQGI
jgi:hypothetical protein